MRGLAGDSNGANPNMWGDIDFRHPSRIAHSPTNWKTPLKETDVLYGDGHVETHTEINYYILLRGNHYLVY